MRAPGRGCFVTGTDTGCGKTEITLALMRRFAEGGARVAGMKPVAAGAEATPQGLRNEDARRIQAACSFAVDYKEVNPCVFAPAVAPHLAAEAVGGEIRFAPLLAAYRRLVAATDVLVVEGVGGWRVPLGPEGDVAALAIRMGLPVVLVVGVRLGCINHALLTAEAIADSGLPLAGWVANQVQPGMAMLEGNLRTLERLLPAPCLGRVPWHTPPDSGRIAALLQCPEVERSRPFQ